MPDAHRNSDWCQVVRERLNTSALSPADGDDVVHELAAHLGEVYEEACARGLSPEEARQVALQEVNDWHVLEVKIRRAKEEDSMNARTKTLWLPALTSILGASLAMTALQRIGVRPQLVWTGEVAMSFYWPWLAMLPVFGGVGAYLSKRAGGSVRARLIACLAPVLWMLLTLVTEPIELAVNGFGHLVYFGYGVTNWIVIPGLALFLGAVPFLRNTRAQQA